VPPVLTVLPLKNSHAITEPITPPIPASNNDSASTDTTIAVAPNPSARKVAISRSRSLTAEYIVFSAPKTAPMAMMPPTTYARNEITRLMPWDACLKYSRSFSTSIASAGLELIASLKR
jgi:hypothetical protein